MKKSRKGSKVSVSWTTVRDRAGARDGGVGQTMTDDAYKRSSRLSVSGEDIINWRAAKCYLYCAQKESRASVTAKLTASCRYPALHLQTLPGCTARPHHAETVIHSNALRKERERTDTLRVSQAAHLEDFFGVAEIQIRAPGDIWWIKSSLQSARWQYQIWGWRGGRALFRGPLHTINYKIFLIGNMNIKKWTDSRSMPRRPISVEHSASSYSKREHFPPVMALLRTTVKKKCQMSKSNRNTHWD